MMAHDLDPVPFIIGWLTAFLREKYQSLILRIVLHLGWNTALGLGALTIQELELTRQPINLARQVLPPFRMWSYLSLRGSTIKQLAVAYFIPIAWTGPVKIVHDRRPQYTTKIVTAS